MTLLQMKPCSEFDDVRLEFNQAIDRIKAMAQQEQHYCSSLDYFRVFLGDTESKSPRATPTSPEHHQRADAQSRIKMCKWCYQVVDYFKFNRETVQIGMAYMDRFLATPQGRPYLEDHFVFQLACITCLYVAIKLHESVELGSSLLCELSRGYYSVLQIIQMEQVLLKALHWRLNPPTAASFVKHIFALMPSTTISVNDRRQMISIAQYQAELAVFDYNLMIANTVSAIAVAAVWNAMESIKISTCFVTSHKMNFVNRMYSLNGFVHDMEGVQNCRVNLLRVLNENNKISVLSCQESPPHVRHGSVAVELGIKELKL